MNREIKFRGQRVDNGKWVYGDLIHGVNHKQGKIYILPVRGGVMSLSDGCDPLDGFEVVPETVGQFTGIKDSAGKEIFQGDIVHYDTEDGIVRAKVSFCESQDESMNISGFLYEFIFHEDYVGDNKDEGVDLEKIGNIYENSELLNQ